MTKLNTDVLKRTTGLLSEIDRVLAAPTLAERVERTLRSAVAGGSGQRLTDLGIEHLDAIYGWWDIADDLNTLGYVRSLQSATEDFAYEHDLDGAFIESIDACACDTITYFIVDPYGEVWDEEERDFVIYEGPHLRPLTSLECSFYNPHKSYPIMGQNMVFSDSAFREACTYEGCPCNEVFAEGADPYEYEQPDFIDPDND